MENWDFSGVTGRRNGPSGLREDDDFSLIRAVD